MRIAIVGARNHAALAQVWRRTHELPACTVVSGGAIGVDAVAAMSARQRGHGVKEHIPGAAGPLARNTTIVDDCDEVEAFPWDGCRGTWDTVRKAKAAGKPVRIHEPEAPALLVFTAPMSYRGPYAFDISRKSGGIKGDPFAPSWRILSEALRARRAAQEMRAGGKPELAAETEEEAWRLYVPLFRDEMRLSYRVHRAAWDALLNRGAVAIKCYCPDRARCHRGLLAGFLVKLGAVDAGEIVPEKTQQMALIG